MSCCQLLEKFVLRKNSGIVRNPGILICYLCYLGFKWPTFCTMGLVNLKNMSGAAAKIAKLLLLGPENKW